MQSVLSQNVSLAPASVREVWKLLATISDPEIPVLTITDLGMVRSVTHDDSGWQIGFTPTYSGCPATEFLLAAIRDTMASHGYAPVNITLCLHPAWTTDWMTPDARERLRVYGISPPVAHSCHAHLTEQVSCPRCGSHDTVLISEFGSTACKALYRCASCREPFDHFKCI
ncbi:phenylacetate-CoA oxygenase subunit PaaJ [Salmonella enterica subsp. enterica serovar Choleraesuis]|nr:phenylacetate-CoA oxygenase subunit PaaJ [Salmonella enterica subsp. enterica serovar Choleraesuis]